MKYSPTRASRILISPLALMAGLLSYHPAVAQEAVVIENGEVETDAVVLDEDGDSLIIEEGGALNLEDRGSGVLSFGNDVEVTNQGTIAISTSGIVFAPENGRNGIFSIGDNAVNTNAGEITTNTFDGDGIFSTGVDATNTNSGTIETLQDGSGGIFTRGDNAVNSNSGSITTQGFESDGILSVGDGVTNTNSGRIETTGDDSDGILSFGEETTNSNSGTIFSTGFQSGGIRSDGGTSVNINRGSITTQGDESDGILSLAANSTNTNSGSIETAGFDADGILSFSANTTNSNSGSIVTTGDEASGIDAREANTTNFNSGMIMTSGTASHGVSLAGNNSTLENTGLISATGENSAAILGGAGAQTVTLGEGSVVIGAIDLVGNDIIGPAGFGDTVNFENSGAGVSATLTLSGVEFLNFNGDDRPVFVAPRSIEDAINGNDRVFHVVDPTGFSVLGDATGLLADTAQRTLQGQATSGAWASVFGASRSRDEDGVTLAYDTGLAGVMAGYETDLGVNQVGFVGGLSAGNTTTDIDATDISSTSLLGGAYLASTFGAFDLTSSLLLGVEQHQSDRTVVDNLAGIETAEADIDSRFLSAGLQVSGADFTLGTVALRPSISTTYTLANYDSYTETGTTNANLEVDGRTTQTLSARAQLETVSTVGTLETAFRFGIDGRATQADDITLTLDEVSQSFAETDSDRVFGGFVGARAVFSQTDTLQVTGDIEYGFAEGNEDTLAAGLNVSFAF
ncbi:MAG: autotransporter domain-containing protein [Pseudomonadota bacterium]